VVWGNREVLRKGQKGENDPPQDIVLLVTEGLRKYAFVAHAFHCSA
jgi:hypothetical protein